VYHGVSGAGFLDWDDITYVIDYPHLGKVGHFWASFSDGYIPVTYTWWSLALNSFGKNPAAFHFLNLLFHILATFVVYFLLKSFLEYFYYSQKEIFRNCKIFALMGALLFAVHPLQVEAVCWVTSLKDLSSGFFACLAIFCFVQFRFKNKNNFYLFGLVSFLLAMLSKPTAVSVLPMILIIDFFLFRKSVRSSIIRLIPWVLVALPVLALNALSQEKLVSLYQAPWFSRPFIALDAMGFYLYKLFFPLTILPDYGRSPRNIISSGLIFWTWLPVAGLIAGSLMAIRCNRSSKTSPLIRENIQYSTRNFQYQSKINQSNNPSIHQSFFPIIGFFLFIAGLLTVSGLIPFAAQNNSTVYDRYVYLSMVGAALAFCFVLAGIRKYRLLSLLIGFALLGVLSYKSMVQSRIWKNDFQLWSYTLSRKPESVVALVNLGSQFSAKGNTGRALQLYKKAVEIAPFDPDARNNLGSMLAKTGNLNEAELHYKEAVRLNPRLQTAHKNQMRIYMLKKDWKNARHNISALLKLNPRHVDANLNLAEIYLHKQQFEKCISHLNNLKQWLKNHPDMENFLGVSYAGIGDNTTAQKHFRKALELKPQHNSAKQNLSRSIRDMQK